MLAANLAMGGIVYRYQNRVEDALVDGDIRFNRPFLFGVLALVSQSSDKRRFALSEAEELLRGFSVSHNHLLFYPAAMETCLEMEEWDEMDKYGRALEQYTIAEPLPLTNLLISRGRVLAAFGRGDRTDTTRRELERLLDEVDRASQVCARRAIVRALSSV